MFMGKLGHRRSRSGPPHQRERGAALVEFAMVMILLLALVMGVVEFGYLLGQFNEVRHGAHEGARLAAVDAPSPGEETCDSMGLSPATQVNVDFEQLTGDEPGDQARVTVTLNVNSLSGFGLIEALLPSTLSKTADFKLEQPASWTEGTTSCS